MTVQAHFPGLRPSPCKNVLPDQRNQLCEEASAGQMAILYTGMYLIALGTSGVKAALPALGADQFDDKDPKEASQLSSFFNWFFFSLTIGAMFGVTFVVWISSNKGWDLGFGVCFLAVLFAVLFVCMGNSLYRNNVPKGSPLLRVLQVKPKSNEWLKELRSAKIADQLHNEILLMINSGFRGILSESETFNSGERRGVT